MLKDRKTILLVGDVLMLVLSFALMTAIRFEVPAYADSLATQRNAFALLFLGWLVVFFIFDLYNLRLVNPSPRNIGTLFLGVLTSTLLSIVFFYIFPPSGLTPKTNLAIVSVSSFLLLVAWRRFFYLLFTSRYSQHIAVIGEGKEIDHLISDISKNPHIGAIVARLPAYNSHIQFPSANIVIAHGSSLQDLVAISETTGAEVLSLSGAYEELFGKIPLNLMTEERAITILTRQNQSAYRLIGRLIEIVISFLLLVIASPFLLLAILAVLIEDGRPFFIKQNRVGKNGMQFQLYKLRSMKVLSADGSAETTGPQWAEKRDPRVTRVGRILRVSHLDEVLQMVNILKGDLALIGPRAERPEFVASLEREIPFYFLRHSAKPGFTGWAQIKFRYARTVLDAREKLEYDLYYLANKSPLFDLGILVKTAQIIFTHSGK